MSLFSSQPSVILQLIFQYSIVNELISSISRVSKRFNKIAHDKITWKYSHLEVRDLTGVKSAEFTARLAPLRMLRSIRFLLSNRLEFRFLVKFPLDTCLPLLERVEFAVTEGLKLRSTTESNYAILSRLSKLPNFHSFSSELAYTERMATRIPHRFNWFHNYNYARHMPPALAAAAAAASNFSLTSLKQLCLPEMSGQNCMDLLEKATKLEYLHFRVNYRLDADKIAIFNGLAELNTIKMSPYKLDMLLHLSNLTHLILYDQYYCEELFKSYRGRESLLPLRECNKLNKITIYDILIESLVNPLPFISSLNSIEIHMESNKGMIEFHGMDIFLKENPQLKSIIIQKSHRTYIKESSAIRGILAIFKRLPGLEIFLLPPISPLFDFDYHQAVNDSGKFRSPSLKAKFIELLRSNEMKWAEFEVEQLPIKLEEISPYDGHKNHEEIEADDVDEMKSAKRPQRVREFEDDEMNADWNEENENQSDEEKEEEEFDEENDESAPESEADEEEEVKSDRRVRRYKDDYELDDSDDEQFNESGASAAREEEEEVVLVRASTDPPAKPKKKRNLRRFGQILSESEESEGEEWKPMKKQRGKQRREWGQFED